MPNIRAEIRIAIAGTLAGEDVALHLPYWQWEQAFVQKWGLTPMFGDNMARVHLAKAGINKLKVSCVEAMRAFHDQQFKPEEVTIFFPKMLAMEKDFDLVPALEVQGPDDPEGQEKSLKYYEQHQSKLGKHGLVSGRTVFDLGRGPQPR